MQALHTHQSRTNWLHGAGHTRAFKSNRLFSRYWHEEKAINSVATC